MNILLINKYLYPKGGDAISTLATGSLLSKKGHTVIYWGMNHPANPEYPFSDFFVPHVDYNNLIGMIQQCKASLNILYSFEAKKKIDALLKKIKPDIIHLNNFAHQISPSILDVMKRHRIPAVMTMRDYKIVCPSYSMLANGKPCERCKGGRYYFCLLKKCTKDSLIKSLVNTIEMYLHHRILHIYDNIDIYISPSKFLMSKVKEMGFNGQVIYLPNFVEIENFQPSYGWEEESIVYVGRLSHEKGLETLLDAVRGIHVKLKIIGDGPLKENLEYKIAQDKIENVEVLGYKAGDDLQKEIKRSMFVVLPSEWYENNPRSVIEAFALGKPVIGARIGGIPELVKDGRTGFTFKSGSSFDLKEKIKTLMKNSKEIPEMGEYARRMVEMKLNPDRHYDKLMEIYEMAMVGSRR